MGSLVLGLALSGCGGGDGGTVIPPSPAPISVDGEIVTSTSTALTAAAPGTYTTLASGDRVYIPLGSENVVAGDEIGVIDDPTTLLPGIRAVGTEQSIQLVTADDELSEDAVDTGLFLEPDGTIEGPDDTAALASRRTRRPKLGLKNGLYKLRFKGPLEIDQDDNVLTINHYFQYGFRVKHGIYYLPKRVHGDLPTDGTAAASLTLRTFSFPTAANGTTTSLSIDTDGGSFERQQNATVASKAATFGFSDQSVFVVPNDGLYRVIYRAYRAYP